MNLIFPEKQINQISTPRLIEESINSLINMDGHFLILERDEMNYVQVMGTENGFIVQFQEGSIDSHYEFGEYMSRPKAIKLLNAYSQGEKEWTGKEGFHKVNVRGFWGELGYRIGKFLGFFIK